MPRPFLPPWLPQRLVRRRADATNLEVASHDQYVLTVTAAPASCVKAALSKEAFNLLTLKVVVSESCVTWATSVPILVFLGLFVLDLVPMYVIDRRQRKALLNAPPVRGHNK